MRTAPDPQALSQRAQRARELLQVGRPAQAAAEFRRLARTVEGLPASTAALEVRARVLLGLAAAGFEVSGRFDEATELLNEARLLAAEAGAEHLRCPSRASAGSCCSAGATSARRSPCSTGRAGVSRRRRRTTG